MAEGLQLRSRPVRLQLGDAYAAFFDPDRPNHGRPQYKAKHYTQPTFTILSEVHIKDGCLRIPKLGWVRLAPSAGMLTASL